MYILSAFHLLAFNGYLYLAIYVLGINLRERLNQVCAISLLCMALWSLQDMVMFFPQTPYATAQLWLNIGALGWISLCPALLLFSTVFTGHAKWLKRWWFHAVTTLPIIIFWTVQWQGMLVAKPVAQSYGWGNIWAMSIWTPLFIVHYCGVIGWSMFLLVRFQSRAQRQKLKETTWILFSIILICFVLTSIIEVVLPILGWFGLPHVGPLVLLIWAAGLTYAVVKYKFLTISPATAADNILDTMDDLLILCDPQGRIVTANHAASEMLGYLPGALKKEQLLHYVLDTDARDPKSFTNCFGRTGVKNARLHLKTNSGALMPVMLSSSLLTDDQNELAGTITVAKDITALVSANQSLQASEKRYRDLVENINDVIFTIDPEGIVTYVSPRIESLAGYTPGELVGRHIKSLVPREQHRAMLRQIVQAKKGGIVPVNYRLNKKDQSEIWVRISGRSMVKNGQFAGVLGVLADISLLMEAVEEKLELETKLNRAQKMEAIGTLAGGVAHDLNNILSGIASYPDFLLMKLPEGSDLRKPLELMRTSGIKAATIVEDLLTLARRGVANFKILNLNHIIEDFLKSPEYKKQHSFFPQASVEVELASELYNINGSSVHLTKTVMNLLSNAFEALRVQGRIKITTRNQKIDPARAEKFDAAAGDYVRLRVKDTGTGIAPQDLHRIFEPFYTKKVMGRSGTGLGMAVVWGTVHDHEGFIDASSEPGRGACFDLYFPASRKSLSQKESPLPRAMYQGSGELILVVDDVAEQRAIATDILTELGYAVKTASSGEKALAMLQKQAVDLLLLDMIMDPGMDGLETFEKVLEIQPNQKTIIASGFSETDRVRSAMELGVLSYLKKPYTIETIGMAVRRALDA